ncbi:MAG: tyrosine-type recombinase/integrase [Gammaproteobacteria bacterium]
MTNTYTPVILPADEALRNAVSPAQRHQHYLQQATADNTRRAYQSAIRQFQACGGQLPADEATLIRYLLAQAPRLNPRTLILHLTALSHWHHYQQFTDPTTLPAVRKVLKGIQREHGVPKRKAKALRIEHITAMVDYLRQQKGLQSVRNSALLQVGYFGAFRCSELVSLRMEHLHFEPEGLMIQLPRSKTDQEGKGKTKGLPYGTQILCPVSALRHWLEAANITQGALFRAIDQWGHIKEKALYVTSINPILKSLGRHCGFDFIPQLSSHSLRRGLATGAARAGASFESIKRQGGWRSDATVREYIEEGQCFDDNAANSLLHLVQ